VALARAAAGRARAQQRPKQLSSEARAARADLEARRSSERPAAEQAREALMRQRFWARAGAHAAELAHRADAHRRDVLTPAQSADHQARAALASARAQREAVEKLLARRETAARRAREHRDEAG
jgi:hypothetical protein